MIGLTNLNAMRDARGPRYIVSGTIRRGEFAAQYAETADQAEAIRRQYEAGHYYQVKVLPPEGSVNLEALGRARREAKAAFDEAHALVRAGVLRALEDGRDEAEVARAAGVDRQAVREWQGKRRRTAAG